MTEAMITINGRTLSAGQAMALRVAVADFMMALVDPAALGEDEHGRAMTSAYRARLSEIMPWLCEPAP